MGADCEGGTDAREANEPTNELRGHGEIVSMMTGDSKDRRNNESVRVRQRGPTVTHCQCVTVCNFVSIIGGMFCNFPQRCELTA